MSAVTTFQLHRSSLWLIGLLAALMCGLMFTAGLSVGLYWQLPTAADEVADDTVTPMPTDVPAPTRRLETPTASAPTASAPTASTPTVSAPSASAPAVSTPTATGPSMTGPSATAPSASASGVSGPSVRGPSVHGPSARGPSVRGPRISDPSLRPPTATGTVSRASLGLDAEAPTTSSNPAAPAGAGDAGDAGAGDPAFAVQLGAFLVDENTKELVEELQRRGLEPFVVRTPTTDHLVMQSVRVGPYPSRLEALQTVETLRSSQGLDGFVVRTTPRLE